jgi:L-Ala-D/L-Glu epimerase
MTIRKIELYAYSIDIEPFAIATGTMYFAQNMLVKIHTSEGLVGWGECSAFPMIAGETQASCLAVGKEMAALWIGKNALQIPERIQELHQFIARNYTAKSAFDMALYDVVSQHANLPLYKFLNPQATLKPIETDLTIGIATVEQMAQKAVQFVQNGVTKIKIKVGKNAQHDVAAIAAIRKAIGYETRLQIDANQGWNFETAQATLQALEDYDIWFCEQPMPVHQNQYLPALQQSTSIPIMLDESVFTDTDLNLLLPPKGFSMVNIKFAKCGGFHNAVSIAALAAEHRLPCMMGGMLESRLAMTAFAHFAQSQANVTIYDMDTALLGHLQDPVLGGATYQGYHIKMPGGVGLGATVDAEFLQNCTCLTIA